MNSRAQDGAWIPVLGVRGDSHSVQTDELPAARRPLFTGSFRAFDPADAYGVVRRGSRPRSGVLCAKNKGYGIGKTLSRDSRSATSLLRAICNDVQRLTHLQGRAEKGLLKP